MLGTIAVDESVVFAGFTERFDIRGKRVVEIGGGFSSDVVLAKGVEQWFAVDPRHDDDQGGEGAYVRLRGVASAIPLADHSVDFVFSCNAFEHIHDLPETLSEMARVLKPGGILYAHFGPIWSAPDGHHLQFVEVDGKELTFWEDTLIPHWAHLVFTENELACLLKQTLAQEDAKRVAAHIYQTDWVNRLSYEDYIRMFMESELRLCHLETVELVDYPYEHPDCGVSAEEIESRLFQKFGTNRNHRCRDMLVVLAK